MEANPLQEPLDLIKFHLDEKVKIKLRNNRTIIGRLHAFDHHLNMILTDVEEFIEYVELNVETSEEVMKIRKRIVGMLFIRGDGVILLTPAN